MNLLGQYEVSVGEKSRIALPAKIRKSTGDKIIITYGFEKSLMVVSEENWKNLISELKSSSLFTANARDTKRFLFGGATPLSLDKQGRFVLPDYLRKYAGISAEVVFVGLESHAELWDKNKWREHTLKLEKEIEKIAETLVEKIEE